MSVSQLYEEVLFYAVPMSVSQLCKEVLCHAVPCRYVKNNRLLKSYYINNMHIFGTFG